MAKGDTFQSKTHGSVMLSEFAEYRALRHAIDKAHGDRERAITFVCRLYHVRTLDV